MKGMASALAVLSLIPGAASARPPILLELFTAQGCGTCGKAQAAVGEFVDRPGVIVLTFSVDYWDYLGWADTFAQSAFAERQRAYDTRFELRDVYTPQVIAGGAVQGSGDKPGAIQDLIRRARLQSMAPPAIEMRRNGRIAVGSGRRPHDGADVWLARYDPTVQKVEIKAGDNRGAKIEERNVVRQIVRLGPWSGRPTSFRPPAPLQAGLADVVIVQQAHGGVVIAATGTTSERK